MRGRHVRCFYAASARSTRRFLNRVRKFDSCRGHSSESPGTAGNSSNRVENEPTSPARTESARKGASASDRRERTRPKRPRPTVGAGHLLAQQIDPSYNTLVLVAAWTGLSAGELGALRRSDVDLLDARLSVSRSLKDVNGRQIFGPTKTHEQRTV